MSNELEKKFKTLTDITVNMGFSKDEAVKLVKNLLSEYKISFADLYPDMAIRFGEVVQECEKLHKSAAGLTVNIENRSETAEPKGTLLPLEVIYEGGVRSKQVVANRTPVGVVVCNNKLLYWKESDGVLKRREAIAGMRVLPPDYKWRIISHCEAIRVRAMFGKVNETLRAIGGDVFGSSNYLLSDDGQLEGVVRYIADL